VGTGDSSESFAQAVSSSASGASISSVLGLGMSGILILSVNRGLQGLLARGQLALDFEGAGMGCGLCQRGIGHGLSVLLAYLRQLGLGVVDADLLHASAHGQADSKRRPGHEVGDGPDHAQRSRMPIIQCSQMLMAQSIHSPMSIIPVLRPDRP